VRLSLRSLREKTGDSEIWAERAQSPVTRFSLNRINNIHIQLKAAVL
jgi:hypothetical protein